jgi:hypothetical protein
MTPGIGPDSVIEVRSSLPGIIIAVQMPKTALRHARAGQLDVPFQQPARLDCPISFAPPQPGAMALPSDRQ